MIAGMWMSVTMILVAVAAGALAEQEQECAVDERRLEYRFGAGGKVLNSTKEIFTSTDCWRECCILRNQGERCNAASFFEMEGDFVCLSIECDPFDACHFEPSVGGVSAKIALFNMTVDFDDQATGLPSQSNSTNSTQDTNKGLSPEQVEEKVEDFFDKDNQVNKWAIDEETQHDFATTKKFQHYFEETTTRSFESTGENEESAATDTGNNSDKGTDEADHMIHKPHLTHSNTGIYGPNEVDDFDYSSTPLLVIGAVVTVVFILVILICVGRQLTASERLKYRPLRDSFPASNSYHDID